MVGGQRSAVSGQPAGALPFRVVVITDWTRGERWLLSRVEKALSAGPGVAVQHRHPGATARVFWSEGERLKALCDRFRAPLFVNSRLDVALGLDAHLHLTSTSIAPKDARPHLPAGRWISRAVHDEAEADEARDCDLALVSPVFTPFSKATDTRAPLGPEGFARLRTRARVPCFALGGLEASRVAGLRHCAGVAAINTILRADDPAAATTELLRALLPV